MEKAAKDAIKNDQAERKRAKSAANISYWATFKHKFFGINPSTNNNMNALATARSASDSPRGFKKSVSTLKSMFTDPEAERRRQWKQIRENLKAEKEGRALKTIPGIYFLLPFSGF